MCTLKCEFEWTKCTLECTKCTLERALESTKCTLVYNVYAKVYVEKVYIRVYQVYVIVQCVR